MPSRRRAVASGKWQELRTPYRPAASAFPRARSRRSTLAGSARPTQPAPLQEEELAGTEVVWARCPPEDERAGYYSLPRAGPGRDNRSAPLDRAGLPAHGTARADRGGRQSLPKRLAKLGTYSPWTAPVGLMERLRLEQLGENSRN